LRHSMRGFESKILPDKILRLLSPADRRSLGVAGLTADEALDAARIKSERDLQNLIESYLNLRGVVAIRSRMDKKTRTKKGTPDFMLALRGHAVALEAKLPGEELRAEQADMMRKMTDEINGWEWVTVNSLDAVKSLLHRYE
jgi:hypothetical protein